MDKPEPEEIEKNQDGSLRVKWSDGHEGIYPPGYLRLQCNCAACVHMSGRGRMMMAETIPTDIKPLRISPVGQYALHIEWSDGHSTGIYPFDLLRSLCPCDVCRPRHRSHEV